MTLLHFFLGVSAVSKEKHPLPGPPAGGDPTRRTGARGVIVTESGGE